MSRALPIEYRIASWTHDRPAIELVRRRVFIEEQGVAEHEEWDDADPVCLHLLAVAGKRDAVGTARLEDTGKIGRVAVVREWRGQGIGARLVKIMIEHARMKGFARVHLNAQVAAIAFYRRLGFEATGSVFDEAGIPHRRMEQSLQNERA